MSFAEDPYQREWQPPQASLPVGLRSTVLKENLESLYANGRENWLDINFLIAGAEAARSVCRLEWRKRGEGTGFLVAPDLILTNYHVIQPPTYKGELETRLRTCEVRFGAVSTPEGGVSAGNKVVKLHKNALVHPSGVEQLDYALLRLKDPVDDGFRIIKATLSDEPIYQEQYANIIQHPGGGAMKVALRYNQVVKSLPGRVYYLSDTLRGSSGSPVFDDEWQVIALHRAAGLKDDTGQVLLEANEGVPILDILAEIKPYLLGGM
jgi:endonuclease G